MKKIKSTSRRRFIQNTEGVAIAASVLPPLNLYTANPYYHLADGTSRNPEGSPVRDSKKKWSYLTFYQEMNHSPLHVI
jgi:hypothetical protein